jgi:hypothetical protein
MEEEEEAMMRLEEEEINDEEEEERADFTRLLRLTALKGVKIGRIRPVV